MRREWMLYVDKTRFLHELEKVHYAFLMRPHGFGKSCWVSLLRNYYDRNAADRFEALFAGTDIARRPTRSATATSSCTSTSPRLATPRRLLRNASISIVPGASAARWSATVTCSPKR